MRRLILLTFRHINAKEIKMRQSAIAATLFAAVFCAASSQAAEVLAAQPSTASPYKAQLERGYRLKNENKSAEAVKAFDGVLRKDPTNQVALTELGYLHAGLKHYATAVKYLSAASAQDPDNMRLHMDLGYMSQNLKKSTAAREQFTLVAAHPGEFQEQAQKALETVPAATAVGGETASKERRLLEDGYGALTRGDKAGATKAFTQAVANDPKNTAALKQLGFLKFEDGQLSEAAEDFEAARTIEPADYTIALQLGYTYERLQKKEQARAAFTTAMGSSDQKIHGAAQAALQSSGGVDAPAVASPL
jgi:Flp pilus assembly protein TadD